MLFADNKMYCMLQKELCIIIDDVTVFMVAERKSRIGTDMLRNFTKNKTQNIKRETVKYGVPWQ